MIPTRIAFNYDDRLVYERKLSHVTESRPPKRRSFLTSCSPMSRRARVACLFGVRSRSDKESGALQYTQMREDAHPVIEAALHVASPLQEQHFVRVDLVWDVLNELEPFGNTHILLPVLHGQELLRKMTTSIAAWMRMFQ